MKSKQIPENNRECHVEVRPKDDGRLFKSFAPSAVAMLIFYLPLSQMAWS